MMNRTVKELVEDISNLSYDELGEFLDEFSIHLLSDSTKNEQEGKLQLSTKLYVLALKIKTAAQLCIETWNICKDK